MAIRQSFCHFQCGIAVSANTGSSIHQIQINGFKDFVEQRRIRVCTYALLPLCSIGDWELLRWTDHQRLKAARGGMGIWEANGCNMLHHVSREDLKYLDIEQWFLSHKARSKTSKSIIWVLCQSIIQTCDAKFLDLRCLLQRQQHGFLNIASPCG